MKDKILYLILGILIGAVITAGCFLVFSKTSNSGMNNMPDMSERGEFNGDKMGEDGNFEKPDSTDNGEETPPEKPSDDSNGETSDQNS